MRDAETVLNVIRDRGKRGLPLEDIYRQLYNRELYLRAYGRLYSNQGAMTRGTTADTVDGMSLAKIDRLIDALPKRLPGPSRPPAPRWKGYAAVAWRKGAKRPWGAGSNNAAGQRNWMALRKPT